MKLKSSRITATLNYGTTEEVWEQIGDVWRLISSPDSDDIGSLMNNNSLRKN